MIKNFLDKNPILQTGLLLGLFGTILVTVLALLNEITAPQILIAQEIVEKQSRQEIFSGVQFNNTKIHIIQKDVKKKPYEVFNNIIKLPNFDKIKNNDTIEFTVSDKPDELPIKDRLGLKKDPIVITTEQFKTVKAEFKNKRLNYVSYNEAYKEENGKNVLQGWVIKYSSPGGYGGNIGMLIGIDTKSEVTGYQMVVHNETPGLGVKANDEKFIKPFIGKKATDMPEGKADFKEKLGIDVISGATITSVCITKGITNAHELLKIGKGANPTENSNKQDIKVEDNKEALNKNETNEEEKKKAEMDAKLKAQEAEAKKEELQRQKKQQEELERQKQAINKAKQNNKKHSNTKVIIKKKKGDLPTPKNENTLPKPKLQSEEQNQLNKLFKNN